MKILFLTDRFNGMAQRLWVELDRNNHQIHVHIAYSEKVMMAAVNQVEPDVIVAPILTKSIPDIIWKNHICLVVHPGIKGDRGASSLDWAILRDVDEWGVCIIEASEKVDAGPLWATYNFKMRPASKSEIYRNEVAQAAAKGILEAIDKFQKGNFEPEMVDPKDPTVKGKWNKRVKQENFEFSWEEPAAAIIQKVNAADSYPGVLIALFGHDYYCYGAHLDTILKGSPGSILAQRNNALCIATKDAAIWLTHLKATTNKSIKLPTLIALKGLAKEVPELPCSPFEKLNGTTWQEIKFEQENDIGYLHFNFYNGAMGTEKCIRLRDAFIEAKKKARLIVLMGGKDLWSNGIDLNIIENSENPALTTWENCNSMNDLIQEIILSTDHYIVCALQGNAGAGGVFLALAGDLCIARNGIVLNPHTKKMGLYGSEFWTYTLPKRIGIEKAKKFTETCLPWGMSTVKEIGLVDGYYGETNSEFMSFVRKEAIALRTQPCFTQLLKEKRLRRMVDESSKPLAAYRAEEMAKMKVNIFENDLGFSEKRHLFVHKIPDKEARFLNVTI